MDKRCKFGRGRPGGIYHNDLIHALDIMGYPREFLQRPRKKNNPEGQIQLAIIHYLKKIGTVVGKTRTMGVKRGKSYCYDIYTMRGKADLECFYKGTMYAIECKAPGKSIDKDSDQDLYRSFFHSPPSRIFIEADCVEDVVDIIH